MKNKWIIIFGLLLSMFVFAAESAEAQVVPAAKKAAKTTKDTTVKVSKKAVKTSKKAVKGAAKGVKKGAAVSKSAAEKGADVAAEGAKTAAEESVKAGRWVIVTSWDGTKWVSNKVWWATKKVILGEEKKDEPVP